MRMPDVRITLARIAWSISDGIEVPTVVSTREVWAKANRASRAEFYAAEQAGYRADMVFEIYASEYHDEEYLCFNCEEYKVIRAYQLNADRIELTCTRRVD